MSEDKFLAGFLSELEEMQSALHEKVIALEANNSDSESVNAIFRIMHTIKSNSAFFGFASLNAVAAKLEDFLSIMRSQGRSCDRDLIGFLWDGLKAIERNIGFIKSGAPAREISAQDKDFISLANVRELEFVKAGNSRAGEYRKSDRIRYKYADTDVSRHIFIIQAFFARANSAALEEGISKKFLNSIEALAKVFKDKGALENSNLLKQVASDFVMGADDSGLPSAFLIKLIQEKFSAVLNSLSAVEISEGPLPQAEPVSLIAQFKATFRVEEDKINELVHTVHKFDSVRDAFAQIRDKLAEVNVSPDLVLELQKTINTFNYLSRDILQLLIKIRIASPKLLVDKIRKMILDLSNVHNKKIRFEVKGDEIFIERIKLDVLDKVLIHIVRNCIDHGIELPEERANSGKPEEGVISIDVLKNDSALIISVGDDGKGINAKALRESAYNAGKITQEELVSMDDKESFKLMFIPGVTSKSAVTDLSGRGVGMDVVYGVIKDIKGAIDIFSEAGRGTRFLITLPNSA